MIAGLRWHAWQDHGTTTPGTAAFEERFVPRKLAAIHNACTDVDRIKHRPAAAEP